MTIEAPDPKQPVDWKTLLRVGDEVCDLRDTGKLDVASFTRLWAEGMAACGGQTALLQSIEMNAPEGWRRPSSRARSSAAAE